MRNIIISAGGTGGHISPGIGVLEVILKNQEKFLVKDIYLHVPNRNRNNEDIKNAKVEVLWHSTPQPNLKSALSFFVSLLKTIFLFKKKNITTVIGMGGYSSFPAILYAVFFKKELFLCEQNCVVGKTVKFFSKFANKVALSFPIVNSIQCSDFKVLGNPIREKITHVLNLKNKKTHLDKMEILVLGGSQGARQINQIISQIYHLEFISKNYHFTLVTGENLFEETKEIIKENSNIQLIPYTNKIEELYLRADFVIARAGAGLISESLLFNLPMILFPYPYAKDNHQSKNAAYILKNKAGFVIEQKNSNPDKLLTILKKIKENDNLLSEYKTNCKILAKVNASENTTSYFLN